MCTSCGTHFQCVLHDVFMQPLCKAGSQMKAAREKNEDVIKDTMGLLIIAKNEALR